MLGEYLEKGKILLNFSADTIEHGLAKMLEVSAEKNHEQLLGKILDREKLMPTTLGKGIALPRCHIADKARTEIIIALSPDGLPFRSFDQQQTRIIALFLFSDRDDAASLLAQSLRLFNDDSLRSDLVQCATAEAVMTTIKGWEGN